MARKLKNLDRDTPMLFPPDLRDWVPESHIVHFLIDAVNQLDDGNFHYNWRGSGSSQYPPKMMLTLLIYSYITARFSSRTIEQATHTDVVIRYICGGDLHPDHDTICTFRRTNKVLFDRAFTEVLQMAFAMGNLKSVGTVSIDGTKIKANASKHAAVSYDGAARQIELLKAEVAELHAKAEEADSAPLEEGLSIPDELARRADRIAKLKQAREDIKERYDQEQRAEKQAAYEACKARRAAQHKAGKKPKGKEPKPPSEKPPGKSQVNFTDPESRIMKTGKGYEQCYNAQAGVDTETMLIVEQYVTHHPNDKKELSVHVENLKANEGYEATAILQDTGYYSEEAVESAEENGGPTVYSATGRIAHGWSVSDLEKKAESDEALAEGVTHKENMRHRLNSKEGRTLYRLRKQTVEPVFGIIKSAMGFRQMSMRGEDKAETEWSLVCLSYNLKRLFNLSEGVCLPQAFKA